MISLTCVKTSKMSDKRENSVRRRPRHPKTSMKSTLGRNIPSPSWNPNTGSPQVELMEDSKNCVFCGFSYVFLDRGDM